MGIWSSPILLADITLRLDQSRDSHNDFQSRSLRSNRESNRNHPQTQADLETSGVLSGATTSYINPLNLIAELLQTPFLKRLLVLITQSNVNVSLPPTNRFNINIGQVLFVGTRPQLYQGDNPIYFWVPGEGLTIPTWCFLGRSIFALLLQSYWATYPQRMTKILTELRSSSFCQRSSSKSTSTLTLVTSTSEIQRDRPSSQTSGWNSSGTGSWTSTPIAMPRWFWSWSGMPWLGTACDSIVGGGRFECWFAFCTCQGVVSALQISGAVWEARTGKFSKRWDATSTISHHSGTVKWMAKCEWQRRQDHYEENDHVHLGTSERTTPFGGFGTVLHSQGGGWTAFRRVGPWAPLATANGSVRARKHSSNTSSSCMPIIPHNFLFWINAYCVISTHIMTSDHIPPRLWYSRRKNTINIWTLDRLRKSLIAYSLGILTAFRDGKMTFLESSHCFVS